MPIQPCQRDKQSGRRWGKHGKCYTGPDAARKAARQAAAAHANGSTGHGETDPAGGRAECFSEGGQLHAVDIFKAGRYRGKRYSVHDLREMARNFNRFSAGAKPLVRVPAVIGHEEDQKLLERSDLPAAGWWKRIYVEGDTLKGDCGEIPPQVARLLKGHQYRTVSAEIYDEPPEGVKGTGKMLRRVAFLGGELPQVKSLEDIPTVEEHAEKWQSIRRVALVPVTDRLIHRPQAGSFIAFCECKKMASEHDDDREHCAMADEGGDDGGELDALDPADILKKLADCGFDTSVFADLTDEELKKVASEILRVYKSEHSPDEGDGGSHDDEAEYRDRDDEDDDPDEDDDLDDDDDDDDEGRHHHHDDDMEEYDEENGDDGEDEEDDEPMPPRRKKPARMSTSRHREHRDYDDMDGIGSTTPEPTSMNNNGQRPKKVTVNKTTHFREKNDQGRSRSHQVNRHSERGRRLQAGAALRLFSEGDVKRLVSGIVTEAVGAAKAEIKKELGGVKKHVSRYEADRKKAAVEAFCEKNLKLGKILPAEMDRDDPSNIFDELMRADAAAVVRKFREGKKELALTELDLKMRAIERRQPRYFGERFKDPKTTEGGNSKEARKQWAEQTFATFSESFKTVGTSKEDFLKEIEVASDERFGEIQKNWDRHRR